MYSDFHFHTGFSADSDTPPEEQILKAIDQGMKSICVTDHQDFDFPEGEFTFLVDMPAYMDSLSRLKKKYAGRIDLRIGIELGLQPHLGSILSDFIKQYSFDFVIGSNHVFRGMDPYYPEAFRDIEESEAYRLYFEELLKNAQLYDCYDVLGHIDYIVRYGPNKNQFYTYEAYRDILDEILLIVVEKGKGIECNTSGLRSGLGHPHPTEDILKRYRELGGEILTLGSDAHEPKHLGAFFPQTGELLKTCGFRFYTTFKNRQPEFHPL